MLDKILCVAVPVATWFIHIAVTMVTMNLAMGVGTALALIFERNVDFTAGIAAGWMLMFMFRDKMTSRFYRSYPIERR